MGYPICLPFHFWDSMPKLLFSLKSSISDGEAWAQDINKILSQSCFLMPFCIPEEIMSGSVRCSFPVRRSLR
jgi:hypothetical protein